MWWRHLALTAPWLAGCAVPSVSYDGKPCPCPTGYRCEAATLTCRLGEPDDAAVASPDAPPDAALCKPTFVKSVLAVTNTGIVKFANGNTTGDVIIVGIMLHATVNDGVTGVTDSEGNTYARAAGLAEQDDNQNEYYVVWYAPITAGSGNDNIVTVAPGAYQTFAAEYSCVDVGQRYDMIAGISHPAPPYTLTCARPDELIVTISGFGGGGTNWTVDANDRSGLVNKLFEFEDRVGVAGANTISVTAANKPGSVSIGFLPSR